MNNFIKWEIKKNITKKKNIIAILIFCIFIIIYIGLNIDLEKTKLNSRVELLKESIKTNEEQIRKAENEYKLNKIPKLVQIITDYEIDLQLNKEKLEAISNDNWKKQLELDIKLDTICIKKIRNKEIISPLKIEDIEKNIIKNKLLLKKGIKPINEQNSMTSLNFIRLVSKDILPLLVIILFLMFSSDVVSCESDEGTFKFLLLQPIERTKILFSKIIAISMLCILCVVLIISIFALVLGLTKGFGSPSYPTLFAGINGTKTQYIEIYKFILLILPLEVLFILFITSIGILISVITLNSIMATGLSILIAMSLYIFNTQLKFLNSLAHLNPTTYSNVTDVVSGNILIQFQNQNITILQGVIILMFGTVLSYIISVIIFKKKDIIC